MKPKALIVLWLIVLTPLALMGWMGYERSVRDHEMKHYQIQSLVQARLQSVDDLLHAWFESTEKELAQTIATLPDRPEKIREFLRNHPRLRQIVWYTPDGVRQHPPANAPLTDKESRFLERTLGTVPQPGKNGLAPFPKAAAPGEDPRARQGWFVWHSGTEMVHFFWMRDAVRGFTGLELEPTRLLSDIIARLPATGPDDGKTATPASRIRLIDSSGSVAYQWGLHEPAPGETALGLLPLSAPLASWRLEYFSAAAGADNPFEWLNLTAGIFALAVVLIGLGVYLYREHTREMRLAQQRVSFVSQVSHELRTPLTNIRLYAELLEEQLEEEQPEDSRARKYTGVITAECRRLSRLIANVLNFSREAEPAGKKLRRKTCVIDDLVRNVLTNFRPTLEARGIRIRFKPGAAHKVLADPDAVEQILNNLVSNMEKYATSGKRLDVESRQNGAATTLLVRDHGPGIPKKEQERIFKPFYRISSKLTDGVAGTGIGLPIARRLAVEHGGSLTLLPVETGACFKVTLHTPPAGETA